MKIKKVITHVLGYTKLGEFALNILISIHHFLKKTLIVDSIFKDWGLDYLGPIDGHNLNDLISALKYAKNEKGPIVIHVVTKKGKGYLPAENDTQGIWHGVGPFDPETGKLKESTPAGKIGYSQLFANEVLKLADQDDKVVAMTPAMLVGSKLEQFQKKYPDRCLDTGITEEHTAIMAAGLATNGMKPYLFIYSSFAQRCYDQINHDICRMKLPVTILLDRAQISGADGETHHGLFDISTLLALPNLILAQPANYQDACDLIVTANQFNGPFVIRYPKANVEQLDYQGKVLNVGQWQKIYTSNDQQVDDIVITYGEEVEKIVARGKAEGKKLLVINALFLKPLDEALLDEIAQMDKSIHVFTCDYLINGLASYIEEYYLSQGKNIYLHQYGIQDHYVTHGSINKLKEVEHVDIEELFVKLK